MAVGIGNDIVIGRRIGVRLSGGGAAAFTGAYDAIPSITAAYGMRRLRSAYTGNILRLRRASDNAELDFGYTASGDLDTAAIATWLTATTGYVVTWYDQSGNGYNATQATAASQPLYVASGQNSKPVARWDGSDDGLVTGSAITLTDLSLVIGWDGDGSNQRLLDSRGLGLAGAVAGWQCKNRNVSDIVTIDGGDSTYRILNNIVPSAAPHITAMRYDGTASTLALYIDNGASVGTADNAGTTGAVYDEKTLSIGREVAGSATQIFAGDIMEIVIANAAWPVANREAARDALNAYWSIY